MANRIRVYADTSVFGGVFDTEFDAATNAFLKQVTDGRLQLVTSVIVATEIQPAPEPVRSLYRQLEPIMEVLEIDQAALDLRNAYIAADIVGPSATADALHVAVASVGQCDIIVSWNFKHIVNYQRIPLYNAVNTLHKYRHVLIHSPSEVILNDDSEERI